MQHGLLGRNPYYQNRGDLLLGLLILWLAVLPSTNLVWSIDAAMKRASDPATDRSHRTAEKDHAGTNHASNRITTIGTDSISPGAINSTVLSLATVGYLWQAMCVYVFSGWHKTGHDWEDGWAVMATLNLETYRLDNFVVRLLLESPLLCYFTTYATVWFEVLGPILFLGGPVSRMVGVTVFSLLQLSFILTLNIRLFPVTSTVLIVPLLPAFFWDMLGQTTFGCWVESYSKHAPALFCSIVLGCDVLHVPTLQDSLRQKPQQQSPPSGTRVTSNFLRSARRARVGVCKAVQFGLAVSVIVPMVAWNMKQLKVFKAVPDNVGPWPLRSWSLIIGIGQTWVSLRQKILSGSLLAYIRCAKHTRGLWLTSTVPCPFAPLCVLARVASLGHVCA